MEPIQAQMFLLQLSITVTLRKLRISQQNLKQKPLDLQVFRLASPELVMMRRRHIRLLQLMVEIQLLVDSILKVLQKVKLMEAIQAQTFLPQLNITVTLRKFRISQQNLKQKLLDLQVFRLASPELVMMRRRHIRLLQLMVEIQLLVDSLLKVLQKVKLMEPIQAQMFLPQLNITVTLRKFRISQQNLKQNPLDLPVFPLASPEELVMMRRRLIRLIPLMVEIQLLLDSLLKVLRKEKLMEPIEAQTFLIQLEELVMVRRRLIRLIPLMVEIQLLLDSLLKVPRKVKLMEPIQAQMFLPQLNITVTLRKFRISQQNLKQKPLDLQVFRLASPELVMVRRRHIRLLQLMVEIQLLVDSLLKVLQKVKLMEPIQAQMFLPQLNITVTLRKFRISQQNLKQKPLDLQVFRLASPELVMMRRRHIRLLQLMVEIQLLVDSILKVLQKVKRMEPIQAQMFHPQLNITVTLRKLRISQQNLKQKPLDLQVLRLASPELVMMIRRHIRLLQLIVEIQLLVDSILKVLQKVKRMEPIQAQMFLPQLNITVTLRKFRMSQQNLKQKPLDLQVFRLASPELVIVRRRHIRLLQLMVEIILLLDSLLKVLQKVKLMEPIQAQMFLPQLNITVTLRKFRISQQNLKQKPLDLQVFRLASPELVMMRRRHIRLLQLMVEIQLLVDSILKVLQKVKRMEPIQAQMFLPQLNITVTLRKFRISQQNLKQKPLDLQVFRLASPELVMMRRRHIRLLQLMVEIQLLVDSILKVLQKVKRMEPIQAQMFLPQLNITVTLRKFRISPQNLKQNPLDLQVFRLPSPEELVMVKRRHIRLIPLTVEIQLLLDSILKVPQKVKLMEPIQAQMFLPQLNITVTLRKFRISLQNLKQNPLNLQVFRLPSSEELVMVKRRHIRLISLMVEIQLLVDSLLKVPQKVKLMEPIKTQTFLPQLNITVTLRKFQISPQNLKQNPLNLQVFRLPATEVLVMVRRRLIRLIPLMVEIQLLLDSLLKVLRKEKLMEPIEAQTFLIQLEELVMVRRRHIRLIPLMVEIQLLVYSLLKVLQKVKLMEPIQAQTFLPQLNITVTLRKFQISQQNLKQHPLDLQVFRLPTPEELVTVRRRLIRLIPLMVEIQLLVYSLLKVLQKVKLMEPIQAQTFLPQLNITVTLRKFQISPQNLKQNL
ncbi:uncharacterized protein LOC119066470 [Bradysia coprophila]|uniref:uncharacterized protein LOC119066470 n=1 Tax=Bradysia coprophila TaxID=38358 RepID=UPI00187DB885|nr:uncharacterized protein LOC119066470 [Bradysia coprophila]